MAEEKKRNKYDVDEYLDDKVNFLNFKHCIKYLEGVATPLKAALFLSIFGNAVGLAGPLFIQHALDKAVPEKDFKLLLLMSFFLTLSILISVVLGAVRNVLVARAGQSIIHDIRYDLFSHLLKLPFSFYDSRPHGKIFVRVVPYVNNVSDALSNGILNLIIETLNIVFIIFFMFRVRAELALVALAGLPVLALFIGLIKNRQRRQWQRLSNKNSNLTAYIQESIDGAKITQAFTREKQNMKTMNALQDERNKEWMGAIYVTNSVWYVTETIAQIVFSFVYIVGVYKLIGAYNLNPMSAFAMLLVMGNYAWRLWQPIINIANIYNTFVTAMSYLDRVFDTLREPVDIEDAPDSYKLPPIRGHVIFEDVTFAYERNHVTLRNISFEAHPGENIALVGPTGAGKTTIVNLISRFYNISSGRVTVDGHDIMKLTLNSLRAQMGIMLQDSFLFSGTIMDNIRYGKLDATDEEVKGAARLIGADSFIENLPEGYETKVNEHGGGISQGEKQLLAFARTLLSDPRILILDEATSSIDTGTERLVQEGIKKLMSGRTSFIIAHRLSTIRECTRIMYIEAGQIVECANHDELIAKKGRYYELCKAQGLL